jgi:transposase, IS30 family
MARTLDCICLRLRQTDFDAIADRLNGRPRQTLGFKTPSQALDEVLR